MLKTHIMNIKPTDAFIKEFQSPPPTHKTKTCDWCAKILGDILKFECIKKKKEEKKNGLG